MAATRNDARSIGEEPHPATQPSNKSPYVEVRTDCTRMSGPTCQDAKPELAFLSHDCY